VFFCEYKAKKLGFFAFFCIVFAINFCTYPMPTKKKLISLVIPAYREEKNISLIYAEIKKVLVVITKYDFEIIFVNDGSPDATWFEIEKLCVSDDRVK
jgi:cellulose synthase/poly-beta-1,6-N-acetylglucosamine synthase-like glycosyltransferase